MADGEDTPRLSAVVERQRRELDRARADGESAVMVAIARGVLMERHGWSLAETARQLADMAAAAGLPEPEMAAAVLAGEIPAPPDLPSAAPPGQEPPRQEPSAPGAAAARRAAAALAAPMEWIEAGKVLGPADSPVTIAVAERARDGAELVGALAAQLQARFGAAAVAVWLLDADGALDLFGQDGLGSVESSRWRRLPPQFDCPEQRVVASEADQWRPAGLPAADRVPALAPWGRGSARAVLGLRDRTGMLLGVAEAWWPTARSVFDAGTRASVSAALAGFAEVLALRLAYGPVGSTAPSPAIFRALDQVTESVLVVRPLWGADGTLTDFGIVHMSAAYVDPAGRPAGELAGLTLLEAYPASATGDGLFALAERVLASGRPEHGGGPAESGFAGTALTGDVDQVQVAAVHAVSFFAGVAFTWRPVGEAERLGDLLDHVQRIGRIGAWEENFATSDVRWTESAFAVFGLDPLHAVPIPTDSLHSFAIAADRAQVRRFRLSLLHRREPAVSVFRIVRPGDTAIRQIRIFAEPVLSGDEVVGLRGAFQDVSAHYHTQVALAATQDQLADSEHRAEQEQLLALRLQRAIMPEDDAPVETAGVDVAVRYRPAEQGHLVAGDWYDALLLPDKRLLLVVGDITGHGIDAVTGMIAARNALRGLAATGAGPADLLRHLNYAACHLTEGIAGTVVCGRYDPETRVLHWARAGHLPPVLVRDGAAELLPLPGGVLLGLDPDAEYEEAVLPMYSGDTLLLFTDGLIERRTESITDALREFADAAVPSGPDAAGHADRILDSTVSDTSDDACLVVARII